jgi:hypothetical protein
MTKQEVNPMHNSHILSPGWNLIFNENGAFPSTNTKQKELIITHIYIINNRIYFSENVTAKGLLYGYHAFIYSSL